MTAAPTTPADDSPLPPIPCRTARERSEWWAVVLIAIVVRLVALWQFGGSLRDDPDEYGVIARNLRAGRGFSLSQDPAPAVPTAYRPPLYPLLLTAVGSLVGGSAESSAWLIGGGQCALGVATVLLTMNMASALRLRHMRLIAGLIVALDPLLVYGTVQVMTETTATFLVAFTLWLSQRGPGRWYRLGTGIAFGMSALCRPTFWAFGGLIVLSWCWRNRRAMTADASSIRHIVRGPAWVVTGTLLAAAPWLLRNIHSMGSPILTTTHGGYTLLLGHNPFYTAAVVDKPWGAVWDISQDAGWKTWLETRLTAEGIPIERISPASELVRDRWMSAQALQYLRDAPGPFLRSSVTLVCRFWNIVPLTTTTRPVPWMIRWGIGGFYALVFLAMLRGLWRLRQEERRRWGPFLLLIISFTAVHFLYWADMRMRAPLVPAIALLAARGVADVVRRRSIGQIVSPGPA